MKTLPKVSILISVHNGAQTLDRCFESIRKQTFQDFEIICINDGSTDQSGEILQKWQSHFGDGRYKLIQNTPNIGLTRSLNRGLALVEGSYVARIDADDFWATTKLEKQIAFLKGHPDYGLIGCNYTNLASNKKQDVHLKETDTEIKKSIIRRNPFAHSCVIFKTALIKTVGKYDEHILYGQDYDLWLRCMPKTKFYNIPEILCYRSIGQGISVEKQQAQMLQCMKTQVRYIRKYHYSWAHYFSLLEPALVFITPQFLRALKRKIS